MVHRQSTKEIQLEESQSCALLIMVLVDAVVLLAQLHAACSFQMECILLAKNLEEKAELSIQAFNVAFAISVIDHLSQL